MKPSEKTLELNVSAEILKVIRNYWGFRKAYLRGLTQDEESREGVDNYARLFPQGRVLAFQYKAPRKAANDDPPYKFTINKKQQVLLQELSRYSANSVFYVFPFYRSTLKLYNDSPNLLRDTWFLPVEEMDMPDDIFDRYKSRTISCRRGTYRLSPDKILYRLFDGDHYFQKKTKGIHMESFVGWYKKFWVEFRQADYRNPWLARGFKFAIVGR